MSELIPIIPLAGSMLLVRFPVRAFRVGGLRFLRIGRVQFSFCICRR